ncbi:hypothetical protein [Selenomonas sp. AE3005]|uniref:hypothetical protein n=1 Tax=Selenomonas sp. AE3005 TaxID=1485543 RepID=UPI0025D57B1C|nr:hypothetical protein [Selenomonas sp. AE3005]
MNYRVIKLQVSDKEFHSMLLSAFNPIVIIVNSNLTADKQQLYIQKILDRFYKEKSENF